MLDLASLEGMYALELARRGAEVIAIEGREANIEKARFAARALAIDVDFQLGDVRDLSRAVRASSISCSRSGSSTTSTHPICSRSSRESAKCVGER